MPLFIDSTNVILSSGSRGYEPIKKNYFKAFFNIQELVGRLDPQGAASAYYAKIKSALTHSTVLPLEVKFVPPTVSTETEHIYINNQCFNYAGWVSFGPAQMSFYNWIQLDTYHLFYIWAMMCGGITVNETEFPTVSNSVQPLLADYQESGSMGGYKTNVVVGQFVTENTLSGNSITTTETAINQWNLVGCYPQSVAVDELDNTNDGDFVLTNVSFNVDLCTPFLLDSIQ